MAVVQLRNPTEGRAYFDRTKAHGKTSNESMRLLERRLSDIVYRTMANDAARHMATVPGGQHGHDSDSSVTGSHPSAGSSDKPLPGPATTKPRTALPDASRHTGEPRSSGSRQIRMPQRTLTVADPVTPSGS